MMKRQIPRQLSLNVPDVQNPFIHRLHLGPLDVIKVTLMSVTVFPIRILLLAILLLLAWPLAVIAGLGMSEEEKKKPLARWRREWFERPLIYLGRAMVFCSGFHKVKIRGRPAPAKEAPLLVAAPHSSFFDTIILFFCAGIASTVSKEENNSIPIIGALMRFTQPVLVKREDPNSRQNTVQEIQNRAQSGGKWPQIIIFPEGTCTNRSCLITFKLGAFNPGVPVQPVCLRYPNKLDTITWTWDGSRALVLIWLTMCQIHCAMELEFLPVYHPSEEEKKDPKQFANNVRAKMAECLDVPVTDHTYDDCRLMMKAKKLHLPMAAGLVEFQKLHKKLGMKLEQMQATLDHFSEIETEKQGCLNEEEFAKYLNVPQSPALSEVFALYDRDGSGTIDFREYVIGLSLVSAPANTEDTIKLAFQLFDADNKGYICQPDLEKILQNAFKMTDDEVEELFMMVDQDHDNKISYDEFRAYAKLKPEYAKLFMTYQDMKALETVEESAEDVDEEENKVEDIHLKSE